MRWLPVLAVALVALWVAARVMGLVVGAALNLIWVAVVLLFVVWVFGRSR
jgi:hypothetical protein